MKHSNDPICMKCSKFLEEADPSLGTWFFIMRGEFPDLHISCSWRGKEDQTFYYMSGKSKLPWPKSKHNVTDEKGNPCARALDLFRINEQGKAEFKMAFYKAVYDFSIFQGFKDIEWGGNWKFKDGPHFELKS